MKSFQTKNAKVTFCFLKWKRLFFPLPTMVIIIWEIGEHYSYGRAKNTTQHSTIQHDNNTTQHNTKQEY